MTPDNHAPQAAEQQDPVRLVAAAVSQEVWARLQHTVGTGPARGAAALLPLLDDALREWEELRREILHWEPQEAEAQRSSFLEKHAQRLSEALPAAPVVAALPTPVGGITGLAGPSGAPGPGSPAGGKFFAPPHISYGTPLRRPSEEELANAATVRPGPSDGRGAPVAERLERLHAADLPRDAAARAAFLTFVSDQAMNWTGGGRPFLGHTWEAFVQATHRAPGGYAGLYFERALLAAGCSEETARELVTHYARARDALTRLEGR